MFMTCCPFPALAGLTPQDTPPPRTQFQTFPFAMRHLDAKKGRFCISECLKHELVNPYPVLVSKADETTAHFKTTILIRSSEIEKVTPTRTLHHPRTNSHFLHTHR